MQLVIDSKFRPFSYDELIKPMLQYKEAYDKVEADYSNLAAQTEQWKDIANQTQSPEAYAMYSRYANDLNNIVDDFSKGMTLQNRSQLLNMKKRYASDIEPIAKADAAMKEANDLRVKAGPDAIFEVGEYNSLDQFLHGKRANNKYQSRDALTKRTAAMTEAAMASAMRDPEFQKAMGDQYWMLTQHTGGSYEDLKAAIANNAQAQNRFAEIKAQVMKDAGYDRYDTSGKQAIEDAINTGLYAGLDKPARSFQANQNFQSDAQKTQLEMAEKQLNLTAASAGLKYNESTGEWERDVSLLMSPNDSTENIPSADDLVQKGYTKEKTSDGKETGRVLKKDKKGNIEVYESTPNGWVKSKDKNADTYQKKKDNADTSITKDVLTSNKDNLTPFYFRAWSKGGSSGFEDYGNSDPNFSDSDAETTYTKDGREQQLSISDGSIHGESRDAIKNYILKFAGFENSNIQLNDSQINQIADKYFKVYRDIDWLSNNHFKVEFKNSKDEAFSHVISAKGEETSQYKQDDIFKAQYHQLRKDIIGFANQK